MVARNVTESTLLERVVSQEVSAGRERSRRSFFGPRHSGAVVAGNPKGALGDITMGGEDLLVRNDTREERGRR